MQCSCSNCVYYLLYFKRLTIINIFIRIKTDSFKKKKKNCTVYSATETESESDVTYSEFVLCI